MATALPLLSNRLTPSRQTWSHSSSHHIKSCMLIPQRIRFLLFLWVFFALSYIIYYITGTTDSNLKNKHAIDRMNLFTFLLPTPLRVGNRKSSRGQCICRILQTSPIFILPKSEMLCVHWAMKSWLDYHSVWLFFMYSFPDSVGDCVSCNLHAASQIKECSQSGINHVHHCWYKSLNTHEVHSLP